MLLTDFSLYIYELDRIMQLAVYIFFVSGCYLRWKRTHGLSSGHAIIGQVVLLLLFIAGVIMAFMPERLTMIRVLVYLPLGIWAYFLSWYEKPKRVPPTRLSRLLNARLRKTAPDQSFYFSPGFEKIIYVSLLILVAAYGFNRTVNAFQWGFVYAANERVSAKKETKQAVTTAVTAMSAAVQTAIDTLAEQSHKDSMVNHEILSNQRQLLKQTSPAVTPKRTRTKSKPAAKPDVPAKTIPAKELPTRPTENERKPWYKRLFGERANLDEDELPLVTF